MDIATGLLIGLAVGAVIGFLLVQMSSKRSIAAKLEEINAKTDQEIKEARLTAKRIVDEAETKAEKTVSQAELHNEKVKQRKIQEAKEKFTRYKSEFDTYKAELLVELKDREI